MHVNSSETIGKFCTLAKKHELTIYTRKINPYKYPLIPPLKVPTDFKKWLHELVNVIRS